MFNNSIIILLSYSLTLLSVGCRNRAPQSSGVQSFDFTKSEHFASMTDVQKKLLTSFKDKIDKALVPSHWRIYDENKREYSRDEYYQASSDKVFYLAPIIKGLDDIYLAFKTGIQPFRGDYVITIKSYDWKNNLKEIDGTQRAILFDTTKSLGAFMAEFRSGIESSQKVASSYLEVQYPDFKKQVAQFNESQPIARYIASAMIVGAFVAVTIFLLYKTAITPGLPGGGYQVGAVFFALLASVAAFVFGKELVEKESRQSYLERSHKSIQEKFPDKSEINDEIWSGEENPLILSQ